MEKYIPAYAFFFFTVLFWRRHFDLSVTQQLVEGRQLGYDLTMDFDRMVPFVPAWVSVYVSELSLLGRQLHSGGQRTAGTSGSGSSSLI